MPVLEKVVYPLIVSTDPNFGEMESLDVEVEY
jgi:hypothetical protein